MQQYAVKVEQDSKSTSRATSTEKTQRGTVPAGGKQNHLLSLDLQGLRSLDELEREFGNKKGIKSVTSPTKVNLPSPAKFRGQGLRPINQMQKQVVQEPIHAGQGEELVDRESDTQSQILKKKRARKQQRHKARQLKDVLKMEDPFHYYFGNAATEVVSNNSSPQRQDRKADLAKTRFLLKGDTDAVRKSQIRADMVQAAQITEKIEQNIDRMNNMEIDDLPSSDTSSDEDDKTAANYWKKDENFHLLPKNVQQAIKTSKMKAKHSEFYYKLKNLKDRIVVFQDMFYDKIPGFQLAFLKKQLQRREEKMKRERVEFLAEMEVIKQQQKRKIVKMQSSADVLELSGFQRLSSIKFGGSPGRNAAQFGQKGGIQTNENELLLMGKSSSVNVTKQALMNRRRLNPERFASSNGLLVGTFTRKSTILAKGSSKQLMFGGKRAALDRSPDAESNKADFDEILEQTGMRKMRLLHIKDSDNKLLVDKKMFQSPNNSMLQVSQQSSDPRQKFKKQIERDLALADNFKNINRTGATSPLDRTHIGEALIALDMVKENEEYESDDGSPNRRRRAEKSRNDLMITGNLTDGFKKRGTQQNSPAMTPCRSDDISVSLTSNKMTDMSAARQTMQKIDSTRSRKKSKRASFRASVKQSSKERTSKTRFDGNITVDEKVLSFDSSVPLQRLEKGENYKSQVLEDVNLLSMPQFQPDNDHLATEESATDRNHEVIASSPRKPKKSKPLVDRRGSTAAPKEQPWDAAGQTGGAEVVSSTPLAAGVEKAAKARGPRQKRRENYQALSDASPDSGPGRKQRKEKLRVTEPLQVQKKDRSRQLKPITSRSKGRRLMNTTNRRSEQSMMSQTSRDHYIGKVEQERKVIDSHIQKIKSSRPIDVPKRSHRQQASELRKKQEVIGCYDTSGLQHQVMSQSPRKRYKKKRSPRLNMNGESEKLYEVPLAVMLRQLGVRKGDVSSAHKFAREIDDRLSGTAQSATGAITSQAASISYKHKARRKRAAPISVDITQESAPSSGRIIEVLHNNASRSNMTTAKNTTIVTMGSRAYKEPRQLSVAELREAELHTQGFGSALAPNHRHIQDESSWNATAGGTDEANGESAEYQRRMQASSDMQKLAAVAAKKRRTGAARNTINRAKYHMTYEIRGQDADMAFSQPQSRVFSRRSGGNEAVGAQSHSFISQDMGQTGTTQDRGDAAVKADNSSASYKDEPQDMRSAALEAACSSQTPRRGSDASRGKIRNVHHIVNSSQRVHGGKRGHRRKRNLASKDMSNFGSGYKVIYGTAVEDYKVLPGQLINSFQLPLPLKATSPMHARTVSNRVPPSHLPPSLVSGGALLPEISTRNYPPAVQEMTGRSLQKLARKRKSQHDSQLSNFSNQIHAASFHRLGSDEGTPESPSYRGGDRLDPIQSNSPFTTQNRRIRGPRKTMDVHQGTKPHKHAGGSTSAFNQSHAPLKKGDLQIPLLHIPGQRLNELNESVSSKGNDKSLSSSFNHVILERPRPQPKALKSVVMSPAEKKFIRKSMQHKAL